MSACKDMWMDEVERIGEDFVAERVTRDEALNKLNRLGFDRGDAEIMLDEAIS